SDLGDRELYRIAELSRAAERTFEAKLETATEEIAKAFHHITLLMNVQMGICSEIVRGQLWAAQVEEQLSGKLTLLRGLHEPVQNRFNNVRDRFNLRAGESCLDFGEKQCIMDAIKLFKEKLIGEITNAVQVAADMNRIKRTYPFDELLTDIQNSAESIVNAGSKLLSETAEIEHELKSSRMVSIVKLRICENYFDLLDQHVQEIPTMIDLKQKHINKNCPRTV
ncbi:hypothetical protein PMAYCL1PPCAC_13855, partial [Pristionchus mayeri]